MVGWLIVCKTFLEITLHMQKTINTEVVVAYSLCPRKAFLLLCATEGRTQEYSHILRLKKEATQKNYIKPVA